MQNILKEYISKPGKSNIDIQKPLKLSYNFYIIEISFP